MFVLTNVFLLILSIILLIVLERKGVSRNKRILIAILFAVILGCILQFFKNEKVATVLEFYNVIAIGYIRFLQMLIFPTVSLAILMAFLHIGKHGGSVKSSVLIIGILLITTAISAIVGFVSVIIFDINIESLLPIISTSQEGHLKKEIGILKRPMHEMITNFISTNPFADMAGTNPSSVGAIVIFCSLIGFAYLKLNKTDALNAKKFKNAVEILYKLIMFIVELALRLTPYGVLALFAKLIAVSDLKDIINLASFIVAVYFAIFIMFIIHGILLAANKLNPITYYKKVANLLLFAFFSRSSSASIPLNIDVQVKKLGISEGNASISSSFGSTLGQNGCAGIYPASLATLLAPTIGINILDPSFIIVLIFVITINSLGIAGVGGGGTFAAIATLSFFNMPIGIVVLLAGVEPIIDMARTSLNVNGCVVSSAISSKICKEINYKQFNK